MFKSIHLNFFSHFESGVSRLPNGNTFITVALELRLLEVSYDGEIVWEYIHDEAGHTAISKAFKYPLDYLENFSSGILGDPNNDFNIDLLDIILLVNFILETDTPNDSEFEQSDLNEDGLLSVNDILLLVDIILNSSVMQCSSPY